MLGGFVGSWRLGRFIKLFSIDSGAFVHPVVKAAPEVLHAAVVLQFTYRFNVLDAMLFDSAPHFVENHRVDTFILVLIGHGYE